MSTAEPEAQAPESKGRGAALEGGNYEIVRARLLEKARDLASRADALNSQRTEIFGGTELTVIGNERVRTENNCVPRDVVAASGYLFFGYNVFIGLKTETAISDVFSLQSFSQSGSGFEFTPAAPTAVPGLLDDPEFQRQFKELYTYYKDAKLIQLRKSESKLLAIFQIGESAHDVRVFRWTLDAQGRPTYVDDRGERDHVFPAQHDFEWTATTREDQVAGAYPHVSVRDKVFIETTGGDLTIKVENNTASGEGVYREPVSEANQSLDDAQIHYAEVGTLILLKILPYREERWRYLVFNTRSQQVVRIDAIGHACAQLPEDHGIIFPGGYYLQTGDYKVFEQQLAELELKRVIRSPNGEDVLYVFHQRSSGVYVLLPYNMIRKEVQNPITCHGYSLFDDGKMVVCKGGADDEPTRVHPMQVWQTPFCTAEFAAKAPTGGTFLEKVGNADLVRGISDSYTIARLCREPEPQRATFEDIIAACTRAVDAYYWLGRDEVGDLLSGITEIRQTAELIIDEFEKVVALRKAAEEALAATEAELEALERDLRPDIWRTVDPFMQALTKLRSQRGHLITLKEMRYMDLARVEALEKEVVDHFDRISRATVDFLLGEDALSPLEAALSELLTKVEATEKTPDLAPLEARIDETSDGLNVLTEVVGALEIEDPNARTAILDDISEVFGQLNRVRAITTARKKELAAGEARSEFAAQFRLFGQSVTTSLSLADTPDKCDEQLARLMVQLEELEGRFSELDEFVGELLEKRQEVSEAFEAKKQTLLDQRQRRAELLATGGKRIIEGVRRRTFKSQDDLNAYFASDPMVLKLHSLVEQLLELGESVKADELAAQLKGARQDAVRGLRDKLDLFEDGDAVIKLGRHRFNVNTRALELTMVPRGEAMTLHLTGTDFYEPITDAAFVESKPYWSQILVSETPEVYRAEYLAALILFDAEAGRAGLSLDTLRHAETEEGGLAALVAKYAHDRYDEGYDRGLHDADAALILAGLVSLRTTAGLLRFPAAPRAMACLFWAFGYPDDEARRERLARRARNLGRLRDSLGQAGALDAFAEELGASVLAFTAQHGLPLEPAQAKLAGAYLAEELLVQPPRFSTSQDAVSLRDNLLGHLETRSERDGFEADLEALVGEGEALEDAWHMARAWLAGMVRPEDGERGQAALVEAAALLLTGQRLGRDVSAARTSVEIEGLLGQHPRVRDRRMTLRLDTFVARLSRFMDVRVPGYRAYRKLVRELLEEERHRLRIDEFMPRVLSSFVRNRLINEVYLPIVGDNLAKQLGAVGDNKRTDLMGLLLLVSPPGYGKTTLMEYIASRLGLVFMKVNGPALGHSVHSLDPAEAPNATARQEVEKINLAFEMGNNVMLYLDDIQHTHPELLQKFISLCDGQRRIEGVWKGRTKTYDLRGKKFCVVMAGNPYTESGDKFQIPDMLSNRADTYNLGDILSGKDDVFALSYIENSLTSNPTLAPLAAREQSDVYKLIRMAQGEEIPSSELSHGYTSVEIGEITATFDKLFVVQELLLKVNLAYIQSAAMEDAYRTEPPFKLQGSYRNMNKLAEKVVSAMNEAELQRLIDDHYNSESQTLTTGAEANLLKLAELRGRMTEAQKARWSEIKAGFARVQTMGGGDDDPVTRVTGQLMTLGDRLDGIRTALFEAVELAGKEAESKAEAKPKEPQPLSVTVTTETSAELKKLVAANVHAIQRTLEPMSQAAARSMQDQAEVTKKLAQLVEQLMGEQQRRVRMKTPTSERGRVPVQRNTRPGPAAIEVTEPEAPASQVQPAQRARIRRPPPDPNVRITPDPRQPTPGAAAAPSGSDRGSKGRGQGGNDD